MKEEIAIKSYWRLILQKILNQPLAIIGFFLIIVFILFAISADFIAPYAPNDTDLVNQTLTPPSSTHLFGKDDLGRDIFSRIIYGSRISLKVALTVMLSSMIIGTLLGLIAGYFGGWIDELIMRLTDLMMAFPGILLAIAIMTVLGQSINNLILALVLVNWKSFARLARAEALREKELEYVAAARLLGFSHIRIMFKHILPNILNPLIVNATLGMASIILAEAGLSFLGLGAPPDVPSWGSMLNEGRNYLLQAPHLTIFPGIAIMLTVTGFVLLGDSLRDALDPNFDEKGSIQY
ncbi:MAG: ABC transporter permease [Calditrichia bacterium]